MISAKRVVAALVCLISVALVLVTAEYMARFIKTSQGHYSQKDPILHHSLAPNTSKRGHSNEYDVVYAVNSYGFRDDEFPVRKPDNVFRILMLGDSFTFGKGVDLGETFSKRLEWGLNDSADSNTVYEVINGGCSSYSPILEYLLLVRRGMAIEPDLVILNYDISDVQDDHKYSRIAEFDEDGKPVKVNPVNVQWFHQDMKKWIDTDIPFLRHSRLYTLLVELIFGVIGRPDTPYWYETVKASAGDIEYDRDLPVRENAGDWKHHFDNSARYLKLIADLLKAEDIGFVITTYPYGPLVNEREWAHGRALRGFEKKTYSTKLFHYLRDFAAQHAITFVNMLPDFLASSHFPLFYPLDGHFTAAGHDIAAQAIANALVKENHL